MAKRHSKVVLDDEIRRLTVAIGRQFSTFGGGHTPNDFNPLTHWMKDEPMKFALGVDVAAVVAFVLENAKPGYLGQTEFTTRRAVASDLLAALRLAQHWLANSVPTCALDGPKPLPVIAKAIAKAEGQ